jgi:hypothetical protein
MAPSAKENAVIRGNMYSDACQALSYVREIPNEWHKADAFLAMLEMLAESYGSDQDLEVTQEVLKTLKGIIAHEYDKELEAFLKAGTCG